MVACVVCMCLSLSHCSEYSFTPRTSQVMVVPGNQAVLQCDVQAPNISLLVHRLKYRGEMGEMGTIECVPEKILENNIKINCHIHKFNSTFERLQYIIDAPAEQLNGAEFVVNSFIDNLQLITQSKDCVFNVTLIDTCPSAAMCNSSSTPLRPSIGILLSISLYYLLPII